MTCPQCGGTLATYALSGREASVCEDCGYVGIAAEHRGDPRTVESWDDALRRFYRAHGSDGAPSVELEPPLSRPAAGSTEGESWDDAIRRFHARRTRDSTESEGGASEDADVGDDEDADVGDDEDADAGDDEDADVDDVEDDANADTTATDENESVEADAGNR